MDQYEHILTDTDQHWLLWWSRFWSSSFLSWKALNCRFAVLLTGQWIHSFERCCSVWLPFLSGDKWSIKDDKRYNEDQLSDCLETSMWSCTLDEDNQRQSEETTAAITAECNSLFVEYFRELHSKREVMKISLSSELRRVWQKLDQTNQ